MLHSPAAAGRPTFGRRTTHPRGATCSRRWMPRPASASPHRRSACRCGCSSTTGPTTTSTRMARRRDQPRTVDQPVPAGEADRRGSPRAASRSRASGSRCGAAPRPCCGRSTSTTRRSRSRAERLARPHLPARVRPPRRRALRRPARSTSSEASRRSSAKNGWGKPGVWMPGVDTSRTARASERRWQATRPSASAEGPDAARRPAPRRSPRR